MTTPTDIPPTDGPALEAEQESAERIAQAHAALAKAQERSYWLDRWQIDLNALMRRPGAKQFRAAVRAVRGVRRLSIKARRKLEQQRDEKRAAASEPAADATASGDSGGFERGFSPRPLTTSTATDLLFDRLGDGDVQAVEAALTSEQEMVLAGASEADRRRLLLSYGVHHQIPAVLEKTRLTTAVPPASVHAMGRGAAAAGGSPYYADLVVEALATAGLEPADGMSALDFGCSSGRVVRALAAAYPEIAWSGCDPIEDAITWAKAELPGIEFHQNAEEPPLPYDDGAFDFAYAISIWSHFDLQAGLSWLDEMHRVIRPGGMLCMTTHGYQTLWHDLRAGVRGAGQLGDVRAAMYRDGFWFKDEFGDHGDHGVGGAEWGTAFLTTEWLAWHTAPKWKIASFAPGRVEDNQDAYVLERR